MSDRKEDKWRRNQISGRLNEAGKKPEPVSGGTIAKAQKEKLQAAAERQSLERQRQKPQPKLEPKGPGQGKGDVQQLNREARIKQLESIEKKAATRERGQREQLERRKGQAKDSFNKSK